ncbi:anti-anti-sigma regulatory factor [Saccharothrix tamanrassetensis]|uniref:Anti-anti-sigma regulatory factor n=1 Tax=Saccharothrix tamanrassetensis TaxID=1051531 RepID=A0A841CF29_9PSEU|nr:STAS domain-containing protein [Saccharothrix tamanrassetensis]MBB5954336.1 anti-anti-sigma regulatory factor [Saccharothrix tamanrassetensis]
MDSGTNVWTRVEALPARRAVVVQVGGEVDHVTIESVQSAIDRGFAVLAASRPAPPRAGAPVVAPVEVLVLDLAQVTYFGSLGLVALLQAREQAVGFGMRLVVAIPPGHPIRRIAGMTKVDRDVELAASVDQALAVPSVGRHHKPAPR